VATVGGAPRGAVIAENVRDLKGCAGHGTRLSGPWLGFLLGMLRFAAKLIEGACNRGNAPGRNARIARRRIELVVAKRPRVIMLTFYVIEIEGSVEPD
jgi:hypothetical protein